MPLNLIKISTIILVYLLICNFTLASASEPTMTEIVVSSLRFQVPIQDMTQHIEVIEADDIEGYGANSIDEALRYSSILDVIQRGPFGIQSDISIRGSTFEQILFLVNGMRVNDPQTGHFHGDIAINIDDIQRIEIMPGGASAIYGHGGFGGIINIITKDKAERLFSGNIKIGANNYKGNNLTISTTEDTSTKLRFSYSGQGSDGYRLNTDFKTNTINAYIRHKNLQILTGYGEKKFGANSFYTPKYPLQWEHTRSILLTAKSDFSVSSNIKATPSMLYRHHYDYYLLNRTNPQFYNNTHRTNYYSFTVPFYYDEVDTKYAGGFELSYDDIDSTRLGQDSRAYQAVFASISKSFDKFKANIDIRLDHYDKPIGYELSPAFSALYRLTSDMKLRLAVNKSFRLPTYTELYYTSPTHLSNPNLKPEKAWQVEGGLDLYKNSFIASLTAFRRWGKDIIDWLKTDDYLISDNISQVDTLGITGSITISHRANSVKLDYSWLNQSDSSLLPSNYLNYLRHKLNLSFNYILPFDIKSTLMISHLKRVYQGAYTLVDMRLSRLVNIDRSKVTLFFEGKNLGNKGYYNISSVPMPGRWLFAGIRVDL